MNKINKMIRTLFAVVLILCASTAGACTASTQPLLPSTVSSSIDSGSAPVGAVIQLTMTCGVGETYTISSAQSSFLGSVGNSGGAIIGTWFRDPSFTQPLYGNSISGTTVGAGSFVTNIYARLSGLTGSLFTGMGAYNFPMYISIGSSGNQPVLLTLNEVGAVNGTCAVGNSSVVFANAITGTRPVLPVSISIKCTVGLSWALTQPTSASITIGTDAGNTAWLYGADNYTRPLSISPFYGVGVENAQSLQLFVGLSGPTITSPIQGTGLIGGALTYTVSY